MMINTAKLLASAVFLSVVATSEESAATTSVSAAISPVTTAVSAATSVVSLLILQL